MEQSYLLNAGSARILTNSFLKYPVTRNRFAVPVAWLIAVLMTPMHASAISFDFSAVLDEAVVGDYRAFQAPVDSANYTNGMLLYDYQEISQQPDGSFVQGQRTNIDSQVTSGFNGTASYDWTGATGSATFQRVSTPVNSSMTFGLGVLGTQLNVNESFTSLSSLSTGSGLTLVSLIYDATDSASPGFLDLFTREISLDFNGGCCFDASLLSLAEEMTATHTFYLDNIRFNFLVDSASVPDLFVDVTDENTLFNSTSAGFPPGTPGSLSISYRDRLADPSTGNGGFVNLTYLITDLAAEGTLTTVPVPAAVWLFGSGLLGLIGIARRKRA